MGRLIYTAITSLDGYVADTSGSFEWAAPDEQVHAAVNDLERPIGAYLLGRRTYDVMRYWEADGDGPDDPPVSADFARIWRAARKVVYSTSLEKVEHPRTTLEREFDPATVRARVAVSGRDVSIGGPTLAAHALRAGIVDELRHLVVPWVVGGGTGWLPDDVRLPLALVGGQRFASGVVLSRYRVVPRA